MSLKSWKSEKAVKELNKLIKPGDWVFEYGAGGSSYEMALNNPEAHFVTVEDNREWALHVMDVALPNLTVIYTREKDIYVESPMAVTPQFKLIINDGVWRPEVHDFILKEADFVLAKGGIYLAHDYEDHQKTWATTKPKGSKRVLIYGSENTDGVVINPELGGYKI